MIWENVRLALRSLGANKLRTLLSLLGIVIGVASVIAITSLGASASQSITSSIASAGLETMTVFPSGQSREVREQFTEELAEAMTRFVPGISAVLSQHSTQVQLRAGVETWSGTASAVLPDYSLILDYQVAEGRFLSEEDNTTRRSVLVLGAEMAEELFPEGNAVGQRIRLVSGNQVRTFEVIGIMKEKSSGFGLNYDTSVYIPYNTYTQRFTRTTTVGSYVIRVQTGVDPMEVSDNVTEYLTSILGSNNFRVMSPATIAETMSQVTQTLSLFLAGIAAISLLVGGIGIMNIMLVAVVERTREIGIRKALGAQPNTILGQFLIEAGVLTSLGGLIGLGTGIGISAIVARVINYELIVNGGAAGLAVGVSAIIGIFFGLYPAFRGSRLDPIKALSYE
jgi:ABC-type antimicrobial peptide transport system permease subunit